MILPSRRQVVLGGLLTFLPIYPCRAQDGSHGCWIPEQETDHFVSSHNNGSDIIAGKITSQSGVDHLETALQQTLEKLTQMFGVLPSFSYYEEGSTPNAKAMSKDIVGNRNDGTVLLGINLIQNLMKLPAYPDAAIVAVCAHEYAHILSYANGMIAQLRPKGASPYRAEQFADYMSGYYAGARKLQIPDFPAVMFADSTSRYGGGDHGTGEQRACAVVEGFKCAYYRKDKPVAAAQRALDFALSR